MGRVRIGTCSWADKTMVEAWYPSEVTTAEARLRYYSARFDTVEADSPYYAIPAASVTRHWAERTPSGFTFHMKAYGLMTGHAVDERTLPPEIREGYRYKVSQWGRVYEPDADMRRAVFELFRAAVEPLREAGKLGGILMQYPPSFRALDEREFVEGLRRLEQDRELLGEDSMLVEFRHVSWLEDARRERVLRFLADHDMAFVSVDAPRIPGGDPTTLPAVSAVTSPIAYVRFHGRNAGTWHIKGATAADRFDYLYTPAELAEWDVPIRDLASGADTVFAMFNNCRFDDAPRNAHDLALILGPVAARPDGEMPGEVPPPPGEPLTLDL